MKHVRLAALLAAGLWTGPAARAAEVRRVAVVIGHNVGDGTRPRLRFAESDADKLSHVLLELGGFRHHDVHLLAGRPVGEVRARLRAVTGQVSLWAQAGDKVVVVFYFSGHSDGQALELAGEHLTFSEIRQWLRETGADVRLVIVDSCKSGALLTQKGATAGPTFDIRFTDDVASTGEALLTSSAAHELALESQEIRGSFFSHHLVSGLRGAADTSGDGRVTLAEAYRYAFMHTLAATSNTVSGPQHPAYDYQLSGQGELVLTELVRRSAALRLPGGFDRLLVQEQSTGQVLAEVGSGSSARLAVPPGRYRLSGTAGGKTLVATTSVAADQERSIDRRDFEERATSRASAKGDVAIAARPGTGAKPRSHGVLAAAGIARGIAQPLGVVAAGHVGVRPLQRAGWTLGLDVATGTSPGLRESMGFASVGYRIVAGRGRLQVGGAFELGSGAVVQDLDGAATAWTPAALSSLRLGGAVFVTPRAAVSLEVALPVALLRKDGATSVVVLPMVVAGVLVPAW